MCLRPLLTWSALILSSTAHALDFAAAAYSAAHRGSAVLVMQGGQERYAAAQNGYDLKRPHLLASGSKSFGCALAVALQSDGKLQLDERVSATFPSWAGDPQRASVTVRQLLQFTTGLPGQVGPQAVRLQRDLYADALATPLRYPPGERYTYGNAHLAVFGALVQAKTGEDPAAYLQRRVLDPIGARATWTRDHAGHPNLAGSAFMTARDWGRYGQLFLQGGDWEGKAVLPREVLQACFQGSAALSAYGLTWWLNRPFEGTLDADDDVSMTIARAGSVAQQIAPGAPNAVVMAAGAFNQRLYLIPEQRLVVVRYGEGGPWSDNDFLKALLGP
ncbi:serine hydrolase domain-containing protein [Deinococcus hopiensis]|nr:serine hydrolase domain-containing protein [Deinococcus hopiensis]